MKIYVLIIDTMRKKEKCFCLDKANALQIERGSRVHIQSFMNS
jgi:hypothetical protein